jgi:integrase
MRFGTFAEEQWKTLVLPTLKLSTQHGYRIVLNKHLLPYWRTWQLREITKSDVQQWIADRFRQKQGWQTIRNAWTLLSSILETAVEYAYVATNPARGVKFPPKGLKPAPAIIAGEDFARLLDQLGDRDRTMVFLIAATGLRVGELLALRWQSVDLQAGTLTVRESLYEGTFQPPKTKRSRRTIPLGPLTIARLTTYRESATRTGAEDLVFANQAADRFVNRNC